MVGDEIKAEKGRLSAIKDIRVSVNEADSTMGERIQHRFIIFHMNSMRLILEILECRTLFFLILAC